MCNVFLFIWTIRYYGFEKLKKNKSLLFVLKIIHNNTDLLHHYANTSTLNPRPLPSPQTKTPQKHGISDYTNIKQ